MSERGYFDNLTYEVPIFIFLSAQTFFFNESGEEKA